MKAFLTGSRAYGTPREDTFPQTPSDTDLVVIVDEEDAQILVEQAPSVGGSGIGDVSGVSLRFSNLNLIVTTRPEAYRLWLDGTEHLKRNKPVSRGQAVAVFDAKRVERNRQMFAEAEAVHNIRQEIGMGFHVSLLRLVRVPETRDLWPDDFSALVARLEDSPGEKAQWGIVADWLDEHSEPELAEGFRWVGSRGSSVAVTRGRSTTPIWEFESLPSGISVYYVTAGFDRSTIPGLVAALCAALERVRKDVL